MVLSKHIRQYITEPDNIYDLAGNCFGVLCETVSNPALFISAYLSEGKAGSSNPNLGLLNQFSESVMTETISFRPSRYDEFAEYITTMIGRMRLQKYLDEKMNELTVIYFLLAGIDAGARSWESHKFFPGFGPLDRINKTGYRVYYSSHDTLHSDYTEKIGRDRMQVSDFSAQFETFRFINTKKWLLGENVPQIIYVPYDRTDLRRREHKLRVAVIPGFNEKNFEFSGTKGSGYRVDYYGINQEVIRKKITKSVERVLNAGCDIIVMPEYITSPEVYRAIQRQIKKSCRDRRMEKMPLLTFSGSGWTKDDNNVLKILDAAGDEIGSYYKYSPYTRKRKGKYGYEMYESLSDPGKCCDLIAVEGWGTLLPAICRDVIDGKYTEEIAKLLLPFLVIISAWSPSVRSFEERQKELANRYFISSILANACSAVRKDARKIGNAGIIHKNDTVAGILFEDICRDNCSSSCAGCTCAYIVEFDFTYNDSTDTNIRINKL